MKTVTRRTEITIERQASLLIRRRASLFCERCGQATKALTTMEVAALFLTTVGAVENLAEAGEIHFIETRENRSPLVCINPLWSYARKAQDLTPPLPGQ